jgi:hypothetical protein
MYNLLINLGKIFKIMLPTSVSSSTPQLSASALTKRYLLDERHHDTFHLNSKWKDWQHNFKTHPFSTLFYTPKILHNTALQKLSYVRDAIGLGFALDWLGKGINLLLRERTAKGRDWYSNYFLFGTWVNILKALKSTPNMPIIGSHFWGGIVGMFIQGYDNCEWQKKLVDNYPNAAKIVGFLNGWMCCALQTFCISFFNSYVTANRPLAFALGYLVTWSFSSNIMCRMERAAFETLEQYHKPTAVRAVEPSKPCCHTPIPGHALAALGAAQASRGTSYADTVGLEFRGPGGEGIV